MSASKGLPLSGIKVIEFAGLAPGPFAGLVLADFGATVIRIDRTGASFSSDVLCRHKRSVSISLKQPAGITLCKRLIKDADVVIDPFRPGVLERLGLGPEEMLKMNERLVFARLTGFRRTGEYAKMAGHDINYAALSGVLSMLGRAGGPPTPPVNLLADFAGGGLLCTLGVVLALFERERSGKGQVVESDMVTGSRYVASFLLLLKRPSHGLPMFSEERGQNFLDGGAPWYDTYRTSDGKYMSLGAIEPHFYAEFLSLLRKALESSPSRSEGPVLIESDGRDPNAPDFPQPEQQVDRRTWPALREFFTHAFASKTRDEWTAVFIGTDACCVPVLDTHEVGTDGQTRHESEWKGVGSEEREYGGWPAPAPKLARTPGLDPRPAYGAFGDSEEVLLAPGAHSIKVLTDAGLTRAEIKELLDAGTVESLEEEDEPTRAKL